MKRSGLALVMAAWCAAAVFSSDAETSTPPAAGPVCYVTYSGPIHPIAAEIVQRGLARARAMDAALFVVELDTPGGLMSSMQDIKKGILNSKVPVAVFVAPKGAQAASAGFFILMAADVAAMAPGSSTGAAHPVNLGGGEEKDEVMGKKILHSAVSELRSVAERRGRNPDLAVEAVQGEVKSFTEEEALRHGLIDVVADNLRDLLEQIQGREITRFTGEKQILHLDAARLVEFPLTMRERVLGTIADPNVLFILLGLGMLGLYVEISNPGLIFPGVIGAVCIILALFSTQVLPINYAGVLLILLAFGLFLAELKIASYGLLTAGGIAALLLGGALLVKEPVPGLTLNWSTLIGVALAMGTVAVLVLYFALKIHRRRPETGEDGLIEKTGKALTDIHSSGKVFVHGEQWNACSDEPIEKGAPVVVVAVRGMTLKVRRLENP